MTIVNPAAFLQAGSYSALMDRLHLNSSLFLPIGTSTTATTARGGFLMGQSNRMANQNMVNWDVTVGPFTAIVENTFAAQAGEYMVLNTSNVVVSVGASTPTTNRIDIIGVRVQDAFYSGALNQADVVVVAGTPTAGVPADPALPLSFLPIIRVTVNANSSTGIVTDLRKRTSPIGSVYQPYTPQLTDNGTMIGETQLLPAAGAYNARLRVWDGTTWRGVTPIQFDQPTQTGSGTLPVGGAGSVIMSVSVADPGFPYRIEAGGSLSWGVVAASTPGYLLVAAVTLDSTTYNVAAFTTGFSVSHSLGASFSQPSAAATKSPTTVLTGAHTIRLIARNSGAGNMTLPAAAADTRLSVTLVPA